MKKVALYARVSDSANQKLRALAEAAQVDIDDVIEHAIDLVSSAGPESLKASAAQEAPTGEEDLAKAMKEDGGY